MLTYTALRGVLGSYYKRKRRQLIATEAILSALVIVLSVLLQTYFQLKPVNYKLDQSVYSLIGESRDDTVQYLKQNSTQTGFEFAVPKTTETGSLEHTGRVDNAFSANLSTDTKTGISVTDTTSKIAITLIPQFYTAPGQKVKGDHIVYPTGQNKLIYTLKYNGLKEDIVIPEFQGNEQKYSFKLQLPSGVEARLDDRGNVGIYSSDSTLFGNISFGSDADRERVDKARENSPKTNLIMTIPAPIIKDTNGREYTDRSVFNLGDKRVTKAKDTSAAQAQLPANVPRSLVATNEYDLTIQTTRLEDLSYPISIDPTLVVKNAADFVQLNNENSGTLDTTTGLIKRGSLTGGSIGNFSTDSDLLASSSVRSGSTTYNGFIYIAGGSSTSINLLQWAKITNPTTGDVGTWSTTSLLSNHERTPGTVAYNGYLYVLGGTTATNGAANTSVAVEYAKIDPNSATGDPMADNPSCAGTSMWCIATSLPSARGGISVVAHNGYMYVVGGCSNYSSISGQNCNNNASMLSDAYRVPINSDGSLGSWTQTGMPGTTAGTLPNVLFGYKAGVWGNYYYIVGGRTSSSTEVATVYYARINDDGTMSGASNGAWLTTTSLPLGRGDFAMAISNGYIYAVAGSPATGTPPEADSVYAPINADGTVGTWRVGTSIAASVWDSTAVSLPNGIAVLGGNPAAGGCAGNACLKVQYAAFKPAGEIDNNAWKLNTSEFGGGGGSGSGRERYGAATIVNNGFIYVLGGCNNNGSCFSGASQLTDYAPLNADGSIGAWTNGSTLVGTRGFAGAAVYNGYIYIIGGCVSTLVAGQCSGATGRTSYAQLSSNGSMSGWTDAASANDLPVNVVFPGVVTYGSKVYVTGGCNINGTAGSNSCSVKSSDTYVNTLTSSGLASTWSDVNIADLPTPLTAFGITQYGNYVYVSGGYNGSGSVATVYVAKFDNSGNLGSGTINGNTGWTQTTSLSTATTNHGFVAYNGYLYSYGGNASPAGTNPLSTSPTPNTNTVYGKINSDGTVGTGTPSTTWLSSQAMATATRDFGAVAANGVLYAVAGFTTARLDSTVYQIINNGGSGATGSFTQSTSTSNGSLPGNQSYGGVVASSGALYWITGVDNGGLSANVYKSIIGADGVLGAWTTTGQAQWPAGLTKRERFGITIYNNYIYVVGGCLVGCAGSNLQDTVVGTLSGGNITTWTSGGVNMASPGLADEAVEAYAGYLYTFGGQTTGSAISTVQKVQINSANGLLTGSWSAETSLGTARTLVASAIYRGVVYVIGGQGSTAMISSVEYAAIDPSNHTVGAWNTGSSLNATHDYVTKAVATNGYIYLVSGQANGGGAYAPVEYAAINPDGSLGMWQKSTSMVTARYGAGVAISNGNIYVVGGDIGLSTLATSERATLQSIPRVASFSKLYDFDSGVQPTKLITRGTKQNGSLTPVSYLTSANTSTTLGTQKIIADVVYGGNNGQSLSLGGSLSRFLLIYYTIDDSASATFPDSGNESTITSFDVYFDANPSHRLKGGRTFTTGNDGKQGDRGLDTSP